MEEIGLSRHAPSPSGIKASENEWNYESFKFKEIPRKHAQSDQWSSSIYRGIVPAKSLFARDFAVNGALVILLDFRHSSVAEDTPDLVHDKQRLHLGDCCPLDKLLFPRRSTPSAPVIRRGSVRAHRTKRCLVA